MMSSWSPLHWTVLKPTWLSTSYRETRKGRGPPKSNSHAMAHYVWNEKPSHTSHLEQREYDIWPLAAGQLDLCSKGIEGCQKSPCTLRWKPLPFATSEIHNWMLLKIKGKGIWTFFWCDNASTNMTLDYIPSCMPFYNAHLPSSSQQQHRSYWKAVSLSPLQEMEPKFLSSKGPSALTPYFHVLTW